MKKPIELKVGLRGLYKIEAIDEATGKRRLLADWFPNLITDNGLELLGTGGGQFNLCCVGSGNTAPSNADTSLNNYIGQGGQMTSTRAAQSSPPYFGTMTITYRIPAGQATGNLAEVGIGPSNNGLNLFSRALILDGGGSPTTITVLSSEALDVTYQLQLYVPTADATGSVVINGVTYNYTMRAGLATNTSYWAPVQYGDVPQANNLSVGQGTIGAITAQPTFTATAGPTNQVRQTYGAGNHYIDTIFNFDITAGNVAGGINCFQFVNGQSYNDWGFFQCQLDASIPKDSSHTMSLTFRTSWGRYP